MSAAHRAPPLVGNGHLIAAAGPRSDEDINGYLLVPACRAAAVVEVHDAGRGIDARDNHGVVGFWLTVEAYVVNRPTPDQFGVESDDHLAALGHSLFERIHTREVADLWSLTLVGVHPVDAVVRQQRRFIGKRRAGARSVFSGLIYIGPLWTVLGVDSTTARMSCSEGRLPVS